MKFNKFFATALVSVFALSAAVCAAGPVTVFDFTNADYVSKWEGSGNSCEFSYDDAEGCLRIDVTGGDPYKAYNLDESEQFTCQDYQWVKISYKTANMGGVQSEFFWGTDVHGGPIGETNYQWERDKDDEWVEQVMHIDPVGGEDYWGDCTLTTFRIDATQDVADGGEIMWIKYIAFFASEEDANAYTFAAAGSSTTEAEAPAAETETPAADAETETPAAAQTADVFSVAIAVLAVAAAGAVVVSKKR